ncbi:MAG TPA: phosphoribosylanthranilate isomerase [Melioribacteraceae bacterium]|nr:phosphoribosylanthranilate isomerase [Melioribacteraceae bacterium]
MQELIQVAGIIDLEEAELFIKEGVDYLGFPLRLPVNKEDLSEDEAAKIIQQIPAPHKGVLITYLDNANEIIEFVNKLNVNVIQLHGKISKEELIKTKALKPDLEIIKSLVIGEYDQEELFTIVNEHSNWIDAYITDTYDPGTGASGATGKTHDWNISKNIIKISPKPVILAGGLNANNVKEAILTVKPAGVDVHTGIENKSGRKDPMLLKKFVQNAREAFKEIKEK